MSFSNRSLRRRFTAEKLEDRRMLATFAVSSLADSGPQTLRAAVAAANAQTGTDTIVFDSLLTGDIQLETRIEVTSDIEIVGPGADVISIDGMNDTAMFFVTDEGGLTLDSLTLKNGAVSGSGGAIFSNGSVEIRDSQVIDNSAGQHGGVIRSFGPLTIESSVLSGNAAGNFGGAISSVTGDVTIVDSVVSDNTTAGNGGAVSIVGAYLAYTNFQFTNSTFDGNYAGQDGGALHTGYNTGGNFDHVTITANVSNRDGGGVFVDAESGLTSRNSILAANSAAGVGDDMAQRGIINFAHTLISNNDDTFLAEANPDSNGNIVGGALGGSIDARLGAPAIDTLPHRPLRKGSPAIDAGDPSFVSPPDFDGRGAPFDRLFGGRVDMGAFESQPRTFLVDSLGGFGPGNFTLRDAITSSNENAGRDTILFDATLAGLTGGLSNSEVTIISESIDILGPEHDPITIGTGGSVQDLLIDDGSSSTVSEVTLAGVNFIDSLPGDAVGSHDGGFLQNFEDLTIRASVISGGETAGRGGAIAHLGGSLELQDVQLLNNRSSDSGGAIFSNSGQVVLYDSVVSGNVAQPSSGSIAGGAIYQGGALLHLERTVLSGNTGYGDGGAIHQGGGTLQVVDSRIEGNSALGSGGDGGAIYTSTTDVDVYSSSITGNHSADDGAIYLSGGSASFVNTTISSNGVHDDGAGILAVRNAVVAVEHSTIAANTADVNGAGVGAVGGLFGVSGATITVNNSIIADNIDRLGPSDVGEDVGGGASLSATFSLIGANRFTISDDGGNLIGTNGSPIDPRFGPLVLGPGITRFHGLQSGSPAIDAGQTTGSDPSFDQRGMPFDRLSGNGLDMGAIETQPQVLIVDNATDELDSDLSAGDLSLREALSLTGGAEIDWIQFAPEINGETILLTLGELAISGSVSIFGFGTNITIDAQGNSRIFDVDDGDATGESEVVIRGLRLTGGDTQFVFGQDPSVDGYGGAIRSFENLTLADTVITGNAADNAGGGLYAGGSGTVTIERSSITGNSTTSTLGGLGGGIAVRSTGFAVHEIVESDISGNTTTALNARGGGLFVDADGSVLAVRRSTIANNTTAAGGGGADVVGSNYGHVIFERSTISGNVATGSYASGGGVAWSATGYGILQFFNSTISGNQAGRFGGGVVAGSDAQLHFLGSTIVNNTAGDSGGGVYLSLLAEALIDNSIVAQNTFGGSSGPDIFQNQHPTQGATLDAFYSFIGDAFGSELGPAVPDANGNLVGHSAASVLDPRIGPLTDNGGFTLTHKPLENSAAIDAGNPVSPGLGTQDQIGNIRIVNGRLDMGSVEVINMPTIDPDFNDDGMIDSLDIDLLQANIVDGPADPATFDLTGDGSVDVADRNEWLALAGAANLPSGNAYLLGDANLDGFVDGSDFLRWNDNKFTANSAWSAGDFNVDGAVDGVDFLVWNDHKFQSADLTGFDRRDHWRNDDSSCDESERSWVDAIFAAIE